MTKTQNLYQRRHDLDWLRILAILLLLFFHVGMFFTTWDWHIKNNETSEMFDSVMVFLHQWRMPLLLFISGAGTIFASARRTRKEFIIERHKRLLIPLLFAMLFIIPPQIYVERIENYPSYLNFYPTVFEFVPYPMGGSLSWHHMWFVLYLLVYSMLAVPLISFLKSDGSNGVITWLENFLSRKWGFISFIIPISISQIILRPFFPHETHALIDDWAYFVMYGAYFLAGITVASSDQLWKILRRYRRFHFSIALLSLIVMQYLWHTPWEQIQPYLRIDLKYIWEFDKIVLTWSWVIAIIGYGQKYLNKNYPVLKPANEGIYPFYILHQTVIILIAYPLESMNTDILTKFFIISILSFLATVGIYLIFIRPFNVMRFFFGMKQKYNCAENHRK